MQHPTTLTLALSRGTAPLHLARATSQDPEPPEPQSQNLCNPKASLSPETQNLSPKLCLPHVPSALIPKL